MFYDKKIKYLDYYEKGERVRGCGFAKLEAREEELRIELTVSGLHPTDTFSREVMLCSEKQEKTLAQFTLCQGRGEFKRIYHSRSDIGGTGIPYWELCGICIHLGGERERSCRWQRSDNKPATVNAGGSAREASLHAAAVDRDTERSVSRGGGLFGTGKTEYAQRGEQAAGSEERSLNGPERQSLGRSEGRSLGGSEERSLSRTETPRESAAAERESAAKAERRQPRMLDDKWMQLCAIYPHVQPFHDERDYLSIKPADFLLFPANAYRQVNNSFLLHGYYNYRHLLLSRVERQGEILYYIGVPGNFYEKEKQVALMFGFESFECAEEPAEVGDFGYYMMRMEL